MKLSYCSGAGKVACFSTYSAIFFFFLLVAYVTPVEANVPGNVTFSWKANPPEDYVIGYRLYYGGYSRFNSSGTPKVNFSYDYYIDFSDLKRCDADSDGTSCVMLNPAELHCEGLFDSVPLCTISKLHGQLYFALTAYNAQSESDFTSELKMTVNPEGLAAVQLAVTTLLLK